MTEPVRPSLGDRPNRLELSVPADVAAIDTTHALLEQLWDGNPDVPTDVRLRFEMSVIEVLGNLLDHAFPVPRDPAVDDERDRVLVVLAVVDGAVHAMLSDNGQPGEVDLTAVALPDEEAESGRGLAMTIASASDLSFAVVDGTNVWTIRCDL